MSLHGTSICSSAFRPSTSSPVSGQRAWWTTTIFLNSGISAAGTASARTPIFEISPASCSAVSRVNSSINGPGTVRARISASVGWNVRTSAMTSASSSASSGAAYTTTRNFELSAAGVSIVRLLLRPRDVSVDFQRDPIEFDVHGDVQDVFLFPDAKRDVARYALCILGCLIRFAGGNERHFFAARVDHLDPGALGAARGEVDIPFRINRHAVT